MFSELGYSVKTIGEYAVEKYPFDILLNAARVGDKLFCKAPYTSKSLLCAMKEIDVFPIDVKQGYAKCSTLIISENAIVTADASIARTAEKNGIKVLLISEKGVVLNGYEYGFIGGASGNDGEHIFFCGDLMSHPCGKEIESFCRENGKEPISLSNDPLYDVGTIFFI